MTPTDTPFSALRRGDHVEIVGYGAMPDQYRNRLLCLGLTPGTRFRVERHAPLGDPVEISLRGFRLSLRASEAAELQVQRL